VIEGKIIRTARVRIKRGDTVLGENTLSSLKRFKDDVREVLQGLECGIGVEGIRASSPATSSKPSRRKRSRGPFSMSAARVAVGTVELHLPDVGSLKGKRHVLKGLKDKLRRRFEISVAEVDHHDAWQRATLAVACVSGDSRHANEVISKALDYIEDNVDGYVTDIQVEIL